ncbi:MAG: hypothetical protein H6609_20290 [Ignavibacteriales bacterium]|nr:hypothetical protein [Ignavibacteriales bacterium]
MLTSACSDDSNGTITGPGGIGGGGTGGGNNRGTVNFTIGNQILQEGYDFDQDGQTDDSFILLQNQVFLLKLPKF